MKVIDRDPQALPVPLGDAAPVRVVRRRPRRIMRRHGETVATALGCLGAITGAALLLAPAQVTASLGGGSVDIGSMSLARVGLGTQPGTVLYGGDASYALSEPGDGTARAAAAWSEGGMMRTATCGMRTEPLQLVDECTFNIGPAALTCVDTLDLRAGSTWRRIYSDGRRVEIAVPPNGAVVPVPFPIGR